RAAVNADRYLRYLPQIWNHRADELARLPLPKYSAPPADDGLLNTYLKQLQHIMWRDCGIVRYRSKLNQAYKEVTKLSQQLEADTGTARLTRRLCELRNLYLNAKLVLHMAIKRNGNSGTHFRIDD
ncbi:hypothetical protein JW905_12460, partial [bacterium]|nr:hypothetical protein [candidate division CSSED10-310 bacterium]